MSRGLIGSGIICITTLALGGCSAQTASSTLPAAPVASQAPATDMATAASSSTTTVLATTAAPTAIPSTTSTGVIRYVLVPDASQAIFRVREQLARRSLPSDAVGTTRAVSGTLEIRPDGTVISDQSRFTVDLQTLQTDESRRDDYIKRNTLQTSEYRTAEFVVRQARGLPGLLPTSGSVTFQLVGDLTIHGVTRPATWDVKATIDGSALTGTATTRVTFEDFNMSPPQVFVVLSVEDHIGLEFDFRLQQTAPGQGTAQ